MPRARKTDESKTAPTGESVGQKTAQETQDERENGAEQEDMLTISRSELNELISSAVASAIAQNAQSAATIQVAPTEDPVVLLFLGGIMMGSTVALGELGSIYRDGGTLTVPKENFFSKLNGTAEYMLRTRQLIVVSGLNDEERERYGVLYKDNELLTEKTYGRLLGYGTDELKAVYTALCPQHRAIAAKVFRTGLDDADPRVTKEKLKALAKIDRESGNAQSSFRTMLDLTSADAED